MAVTLIDFSIDYSPLFIRPKRHTRSSVTWHNNWLADIDGSYGSNDSGIFFFTTDGKYIEWTGDYLYSDMPFEVDEPVLKVKEDRK